MKIVTTLLLLFLLLITGSALVLKHEVAIKKAYDQQVAAQKRRDFSITIVEGKRREEIAQQFEAAGICQATDFLTASSDKEGYLFPDTYRFFKDTSASEVVAAMTEDFATRTQSIKPTANQVILASIVEREAINDTDRPLIAGIYQHRLDIGMKLQSDPTVQYAKDTLAQGTGLLTTYWQPITSDEYSSVTSPYNTYITPVLPPGPISDPGLRSLEAAVSPKSTDQLFFLYKDGKLLTSKTLQQHIAQE